MEGLLAAEPAILVELQTIGIVLLVLESIVIPLLALGAGQRDLNAHGISPSRGIPSKTSPLMGAPCIGYHREGRLSMKIFPICLIFLRLRGGYFAASILSRQQADVHPLSACFSAFVPLFFKFI